MPGAGAALGGCWRVRYSENQTAMLTPLTSVNKPHHRATGFDHARDMARGGLARRDLARRDLARAGKFKLIGHSTCNVADILT
jgi:hypothetical protein